MSYLLTRVAQGIYKCMQQGTKTDVWQNIDGVTLREAAALAPNLLEAGNSRTTKDGYVRVKAVMPLDKVELEEWDTRRGTHGASAIDDQGNSWHSVGIVVEHVTPPSRKLNAPYLRIVALVCTISGDNTFKLDLSFYDSKQQKFLDPEWSEMSTAELEQGKNWASK